MAKVLLGSVQAELEFWDQLPGTAPTRSRLTLIEFLTHKTPKNAPKAPNFVAA